MHRILVRDELIERFVNFRSSDGHVHSALRILASRSDQRPRRLQPDENMFMPDSPLRVSDFQAGTENYAIGGHAFSWSGVQLQGLDNRGNFDFPRPVSADLLAANLCEIDQRSGRAETHQHSHQHDWCEAVSVF